MAVVAVACVFLLSAVLAGARIAPQRGIMGIHLGMRGTEVIQKKGTPDAERVVPNEILGHQRILRYGKTKAGLSGPTRKDTVVAVTTGDRRQRTSSGVGVGSKEKAVKNRINGITCRTEAGARHCVKGAFLPGHRVTDFSISAAHRVKRVTVSFVID
jgi:hypothetical protein